MDYYIEPLGMIKKQIFCIKKILVSFYLIKKKNYYFNKDQVYLYIYIYLFFR